MNKEAIASISVAIAGILWGIMGIFVKMLIPYGFTTLQISAVRIITGAMLIFIYVLFFNRKLFKIDKKDIPIIIAMGIISVLFMSWFYFNAITYLNLSMAGILLYTAPIWVILISAPVFKEKITIKKLISLFTAFFGCVLVSGFSPIFNIYGILFGLGSAVAYASYSIFGKCILDKYSPVTVTMYAFLIGGFSTLAICTPQKMIGIISANLSFKLILIIILFGALTITTPFILYSFGLKHISAGKTAIMSFIEPIVATIAGTVLYHDKQTIPSVIGIILVLSSLVFINTNNGKHIKN